MLNKKMLLTGISMLAIMGLVATPAAFAASDTTNIVNSGDDAQVTTSSSTSTNVNVSNTNVAAITQQVQAHVNTGHNSADGNISLNGAGTSIMTGSALSQIGLDVDANENQTAIAVSSGDGDSNLTDIVNTGDDADIDTSANSTTNVSVNSMNSAFVQQAANIHANTGHNDADDNIGSGPTLTTGNAAAAVGFDVDVNDNTTAIGLGGGMSSLSSHEGGNMTSIVNTGDDLDTDTNVHTSTSMSSSSSNLMTVLQSIMTHTNSGHNDADDNIGGTGMMTGGAGVQVGSAAEGNSNSSFIGNIMDMLFFWLS
ncbi:hypothetical protein IPM65_05660 [Candidatus Roizmanbacteria bacterium]|nr:MAG: hypothetical protein IPM65_05660 [Candidatus Roizmanbacteria bacterium]